ncbi:hypothetical protein SK128_024225 [Halocaridina rubra]|uniref:Uncharacterized protein n=1 Tax=Halocaridina rubra TaxID=373956 RepID=A0AAN8WGF4_HALRR
MDHDNSSREASQGFEAEQETREVEGDLGNAEAEAEATSEASVDTRRDPDESQEQQSERPQPSAGPSQPSSSSQGIEGPSQTSARPHAPPRPGIRHERPTSVSRQNLAPFSQLPQYEEGGDDSIVPSTPTLFVPRRGDGFSEAVSSPQVPSSGFIFGSNPDIPNPSHRAGGLAQMAEGGLIDDTRIDLGQLDDGNRSQPTTPVHRSPSGNEGGVSTSEGGTVAQREPPVVVVTGAEQSNDEASQGSRDNFPEADSMAAAVDDGEGEDEEGEEEDIEDEEEEDEEDIRDEEDSDEVEHVEEEEHGHVDDMEERGESDDSSQPAQEVASGPVSSPTSPSQRRITPITWRDPSHGRLDRDSGPSIFGGRPRGLLNRERGRGMMGRGVSPLMRGGTARARRSRPSFSRGGT